MNPRAWRAGALALGIIVVVLVATQRAAGQPNGVDPAGAIARTTQNQTSAPPRPALPESANLVLLGAAFVVVAQQLRRMN